MNPINRFFGSLILCISLSCAAFSQSNYALAKNKLYPELESHLQTTHSKDDNLWRGIIQSAYLQATASEENLSRVKINAMPDSLAYLYWLAHFNNVLNTYSYKKSEETAVLLMKKYRRFYNADTYESLEEDRELWHAVAAVPPQELQKKGNDTITLAHDSFGLQKIKAAVNDSSYDFVFDTGAGICTATESFALKAGIQIIPGAGIHTMGSAGNKLNGRMGVLDELRIGGITVRHILFYIFPDSAMTFAGGRLVIPAIVGFPIIKAFGTYTQTDSTIIIPENDPVDTAAAHNLVVQDQVPIIYLRIFNRILPFVFDTGNNTTTFGKKFYAIFKSRLHGEMKKGMMQGAGAGKSFREFVVDSLSIAAGMSKTTLTKLRINTESNDISGDEYFGNIGQSVIKKFRSMTVSFTNATVSFE